MKKQAPEHLNAQMPAYKSKRRYQKTAMLFSLGLHPCSKAVKSEQTLEQSGNHAVFVDIDLFG